MANRFQCVSTRQLLVCTDVANRNRKHCWIYYVVRCPFTCRSSPIIVHPILVLWLISSAHEHPMLPSTTTCENCVRTICNIITENYENDNCFSAGKLFAGNARTFISSIRNLITANSSLVSSQRRIFFTCIVVARLYSK